MNEKIEKIICWKDEYVRGWMKKKSLINEWKGK